MVTHFEARFGAIQIRDFWFISRLHLYFLSFSPMLKVNWQEFHVISQPLALIISILSGKLHATVIKTSHCDGIVATNIALTLVDFL